MSFVGSSIRNVRLAGWTCVRLFSSGPTKPTTPPTPAPAKPAVAPQAAKPATAPPAPAKPATATPAPAKPAPAPTKVGPGASKDGPYKNPEYYTYNALSYYDVERDMKPFRIPQPSSLKK